MRVRQEGEGIRVNQVEPFHLFPWLTLLGVHLYTWVSFHLLAKENFSLPLTRSTFSFYLGHRQSNKHAQGHTAGKGQSQDIKCEQSEPVPRSLLKDPRSPEASE